MKLRENKQRAKMATNLFYILFITTVLSSISKFLWLNYLNSGIYTVDTLQSQGYRQFAVEILHIVVYIFGIVFFIRWFRRAYFNLHTVTPNLKYSEGWAAGSWFVPILNLFRPYQIMKEIWIEMQRVIDDANFQSHGILRLWWIFWLLRIIGDNVVYNLPENNPEELITIAEYSLISNAISLIGLTLIILIIKRVSEFEDKFYASNHELTIEDHLIDDL